MATINGNLVRFGCFEVDRSAGRLLKRGLRINLREQSFQVLCALLDHPGEVVAREQLQQWLWQENIFVDFDNNLNAVVAHLRERLGDSAEHPRFIETLPKRGYRFIGEIQALPTAAASPPARARLMVLPLLNSNGDPAQEYFSDAMTDEVITALASILPEQLAVIARTTSMHYKRSHKDIACIARELNLDYVVEGGVRRTEGRVAANIQVIRTSDQTHLFAKRYETELSDIFHMQSSIAGDIAEHLPLAGARDEFNRRLTWVQTRRKPTENLAAYNEYIQGRYLVERLTAEAMATAKQRFENAIELDPEFALAHMALADLYSWIGYTGYKRPIDAYAIGVTHAFRAAELDSTLAEAHAVLAAYHKQLDYNWPGAEREMARARELNRTSPLVRFYYALAILMPHNRIREALGELEGALEADPLAGGIRCWFGIMLLLAQQYDRAIHEAERMHDLEPNSCWPPFITGIAYRQKFFEAGVGGTPRPDFAEKAVVAHQRSVELGSGSDHLLGWFGFALGVCGRETEARAVLDRLQRSERYVLPSSVAHVHLGLGDRDAALAWFDRAVEERDQNMMPILSYAHFDQLRNDPRFAVLLRKMKLG